MVRKHIVFRGEVQGVGFRWRARHSAERFGCTGYCRNEWDGSVTMEIQGAIEDIDQVIREIEAGHFVRIEEMDMKQMPVNPRESRFRTE